MNHVSIIMVCFRIEDRLDRSIAFHRAVNAIHTATDYPYEFILVDNTENNRGLGAARNLGASLATGKYLVFIDDDVEVLPGWLSECIRILAQIPGKYIASPMHSRGVHKYELSLVQGYRQNYRAGSNCLVMTRETFADIGLFVNIHPRVDGVKFCDAQVRKGYTVLLTKTPKAIDLGLKKHSYGKMAPTDEGRLYQVMSWVRRHVTVGKYAANQSKTDLLNFCRVVQLLPSEECRALEIGTASGSTAIAYTLFKRSPLHCVDLIKVPELEQSLERAGVQHLVNFIAGDSSSVRSPVSFSTLHFLHIDGDHSYEGCKKDCTRWLPYVNTDARGIVMWHDYGNKKHPGVRQAVDEVLQKWQFEEISLIGGSYRAVRLLGVNNES